MTELNRSDLEPHVQTPTEPERRAFLRNVGVAAAGFALLSRVPDATAQAAPAAAGPAPAVAPPSPAPAPQVGFGAYLDISDAGEVRIVCPQIEIGQGVYDSLPRILADELEADWPKVVVLQPFASAAFVSPVSKRQKVGGSDSIIAYADSMRHVGAAGREMLVSAAAARWGVDAASCKAREGRVLHEASGRSAGYGELARDAAKLPVPAKPRLKSPGELRLVGQRLTRKDTPLKVDGTAVYGTDVKLPGMLHAALRRTTSLHGTVKRFDAASVSARPGVVAVVPLADSVAVVADTFWHAKQAAEALDIEFDESLTRGLSSAGLSATMRRALGDDAAARQLPLTDYALTPPKRVPGNKDVVEAALATAGGRRIDVSYEVPYVAHMTQEPQVCTALITDDRCEIWAPHQQPDNAHKAAAKFTGLPMDRVRLNITFGGGGFGRKWETDVMLQALQIAKAVKGRPVKLSWTREQDVQHDFYKPAYVARYRGAVSSDGKVLAVHARLAGQSLFSFKRIPSFMPGIPDPTAIGGLIADEYDLGSRLSEFVEVGAPVPIGWWRSVALAHNGFFGESMIDELATAAGQDPYEFRKTQLARHPRAIAVLERVAKESGWGRKLGAGRGRGIAVSFGFGSICAQVAEVTVRGKSLRVDRITCAYDCGTVIDPGIVEAQLFGGIVFGLGAALAAEITLERGAVKQTNFHEHPVMRIHEIPRIDVHLVRSNATTGGVGEASVPPVAPAVANAIFAATGRRARKLPLRSAGFDVVAS